ncbi:MAG: OmpA family protein [Candidatus Binatia bacterium]
MGNARWLVVGVGLLMGLPSAGWAQAVKPKKAAPAAPVEIEEIVVTAQKREENIQEVPISVTALSGVALAERGASSITDLRESVPNLYIAPVGQGVSGTNISMRGTSNNDPSLSQNATVGLYVDGFYIAKIIGNNLDLEDLERVEVLRGPQGTLFGRNTTGGAVNMVTKKPTEELSLTAGTEVGNYDAFKGRVTVNVPLVGQNGYWKSDALGTISLRENVVYKSHDGYADNRSPTSVKASGGSELGTLNRVFNMTALRWQPTKAISIDYSFEYHRHRQTPPGWQVTKVFPRGDPNYNPRINPGGSFDMTPYVRKNRAFGEIGNNAQMDSNANLDQTHRLADDGNHRMHILTAAWDLGKVGPLGNVTVKSISGYRAFSRTQTVDLDGTPLHAFDASGGQQNLDTWSTELQWIGTAQRLRYVLGAYYYGEHITYQTGNLIYQGEVNLSGTSFGKNSSYAPFGQLTWTPPILNDKLSVTAGVRYSEDHIHSQHINRCHYVTIPGLGTSGPNLCDVGIPQVPNSFNLSLGRTFGREGAGLPGLSPMANIAYQWTDELMTYARASRGYQSGVAQDVVTDASLFNSTAPERLESYEAGFKSQWLDNRLRFNADGFFSRYKDQVVSFQEFSSTGGLTTRNLNAGKSEYWGSEVELAAVPLRGLEVTGNYAYLSAKYLEYPGTQVVDGKPVTVDVADQRKVQYAPEHTFTIGATYTAPPTTTGIFSAHLDTYWTDDFVGHAEPPYDDKGWSYAVVNGRLQLVDIPLAKGSLDLSVFGRNLFDRKYRLQGFGLGSLGWMVNAYGDPRTFGLGMTYHFTAAQEAPPPPAPVAQAAPPPPPPTKKKIVLRSVHFDFDKATLKAEAKPILDEAVQVLKQEGSVDIIVEGHTDSVGTDQYNLGLSRRRAETVRTYLVEHGIARSRITAEGMGESKPVASNDTADGRAQNRRVELHVK